MSVRETKPTAGNKKSRAAKKPSQPRADELPRRSHRKLALRAAAIIAVTVALVGGVALRSANSPSIPVQVNGHRIVDLASPAPVHEVLREAGVRPRVGILRTASGRVLDPHWSPPVILVNGRPSTPNRVIRSASRVRVVGGHDAVEGAVVRLTTAGFWGGLPDVERDVWSPGVGGRVVEVVGSRSGEVQRRFPLTAPTAPSPQPGKTVALTFDDGPDPRNTPQLLQVLDAAGIKATFCVIGFAARAHPDIVTAIAAHGHVLCDHTETHPYLDRLPGPEVDSQLVGPALFLLHRFGHGPAFARAPYGALNPNVIAIAHRQGLRVLGWSVDPSDYLRPPPGTIVSRVLSQVHPGAIVLMHDGGGDRSNTVAALPPLIAALRGQGYTFVQPQVSDAGSPPETKLVTSAQVIAPVPPVPRAARPPAGTAPGSGTTCARLGARPPRCPRLGE